MIFAVKVVKGPLYLNTPLSTFKKETKRVRINVRIDNRTSEKQFIDREIFKEILESRKSSMTLAAINEIWDFGDISTKEPQLYEETKICFNDRFPGEDFTEYTEHIVKELDYPKCCLYEQEYIPLKNLFNEFFKIIADT